MSNIISFTRNTAPSTTRACGFHDIDTLGELIDALHETATGDALTLALVDNADDSDALDILDDLSDLDLARFYASVGA